MLVHAAFIGAPLAPRLEDSPSAGEAAIQGVARELPAIPRALRELGRASLDRAQAVLARSALSKLERGARALGGGDSLESGLARLLAAQLEEGRQRCDLAISTVEQKHAQIRQQRMLEQEELRKRAEAEKNKSFWNKLVDIFKAIGAAISAASSIFTGAAGMVGAALLIASIIVAHTAKESWGGWVSLGLSLAGAVCGGFAGAGGSLATKVVQIAQAVGSAVSSTCTVSSGAATVAGAVCGRDALGAEASATELRAAQRQARIEEEDERALLGELTEAEARGVEAVTRALSSHASAALCAAGR